MSAVGTHDIKAFLEKTKLQVYSKAYSNRFECQSSRHTFMAEAWPENQNNNDLKHANICVGWTNPTMQWLINGQQRLDWWTDWLF